MVMFLSGLKILFTCSEFDCDKYLSFPVCFAEARSSTEAGHTDALPAQCTAYSAWPQIFYLCLLQDMAYNSKCLNSKILGFR